MKPDSIIIDYDPFAMESRVNIYKDGAQEHISIHSEISSLANEVIKLAYEREIYNVKSHAPFAFTSEIARQIHEFEQSQYSQKKISVEGL